MTTPAQLNIRIFSNTLLFENILGILMTWPEFDLMDYACLNSKSRIFSKKYFCWTSVLSISLFELFFVWRFKKFFLIKKKTNMCQYVALCVVFFFFSEKKRIDQKYLLCLNLCAVLKSFEFFLSFALIVTKKRLPRLWKKRFSICNKYLVNLHQ